MTITSTANRITVAGNGSITSFAFDFVGVSPPHIQVTFTDANGNSSVVPANDVSIVLNPPGQGQIWGIGGTVTYPLTGSPIALGTSLTIERILPLTQTTTLANQGAFFPQAVEQALDTVVMEMQQVGAEIGNAIVAPASDPGGLNYTLPAVADRAGQMVGFDSSGNVIAAQPSSALVSSAMQPVVAAASIAAAQALLGISATASIPIGGELDWPGLIAPAQFFLEYGQSVSRTGYPELFNVLAPTFGGSVSFGSPNVTGLSSTAGMGAGMAVEGINIPIGATILSVLTGTSIQLSANATGNGTSIRVFPFGNGDGSTTFTLPDGRGYASIGRDNMGGSAAGRVTTGGSGFNAQVLGLGGGEQTHTLSAGELAQHTHSGTTGDDNQNHTHTQDGFDNVSANINSITGQPASYVSLNNKATSGASNAHQHPFTTDTGSGVNGSPHNNIQPSTVRNRIIFAGRAT